MPTYQHKCAAHGVFDDVRSIREASRDVPCPVCGALCANNFDYVPQLPGAIIGAGDTTTTISDPNDKTKPYRFKEGTKAGQKAEIRRVMEERFQRDNKAPWKVDVDVSEY